MEDVHVVVSEIRKNVHMVKFYYICNVKRDKIQELKNNQDMEFHGEFDTQELAKKFMDSTTFSNCKEYTKMLNETDLPDKNTLMQSISRHMIAYIGDDLTTVPNTYDLPIYEFMVLKENYSSVRLATPEELIHLESHNPVIPVTQLTLDNLKKLNLLKLQVSLNSDPSSLKKADEDYNQVWFNTMKLMMNLERNPEESDKLSEILFPWAEPAMMSSITDALKQMTDFVKEARAQGMSDVEIEREIFKGFEFGEQDEQTQLETPD